MLDGADNGLGFWGFFGGGENDGSDAPHVGDIGAPTTCMEFTEVSECDMTASMIVIGNFDPTSCSATVTATGASTINLGWCNASFHTGAMTHEIGHVLGLGHEQKRPDRDSFISINWTAVEPGWVSEYTMYSSQADHHRPYNYDSIMHYSVGNGEIVTPAGIRVGRRTGSFDGNDVSQVHHVLTLTAVALRPFVAY